MRTIFVGLRGVALWLVLSSMTPVVHALEDGVLAPDFKLPSGSDAVQLSQYRGKVVYLDFWASWCGPCRQSFPFMNTMQARYGGEGLQVVAINLDVKPADVRKFLAVNPATFAVAYDPEGHTPRLYGVKAMPSSFLIGRDGRLALSHSGFVREDEVALERSIRQALGVNP